ncbi:MAG: class aldolase/adducin family protein [Paenibacillaceae bacterium]|jgi:L-fuculose-phosphate aldolase|nr:class aldolase/adducin family protein [Paenibacillaceae bacterium]
MQFELLHPADQIIMMMERIYGYGMTTTSGGNLSILDDNGDIWITPASVDKGNLNRGDIVCVKADGTVIGKHKPSSEFPFHQMVFRTRSDLKAIVHAHPPALVAFSIVRKAPDMHLLPFDHGLVGEVRIAEYGLPGSAELADKVAAVFAQGYDSVMLENHGVVVGGANLFDAFKSFETLEFMARIEINARRLGTPVTLTDEQLAVAKARQPIAMGDFKPQSYSSEEREARREMCRLIQRSYDQRLFTSGQGSFSQRLEDGSFIITPFGLDRKYLEPGDLVRVSGGAKEAGKLPSRAVALHQHIYETHAHINSVIIAHPPYSMAFAVTSASFDSRTIPESYILLRRTPRLPFGAAFLEPQETAAIFTKDKPIVICENDCIIATGSSLLNAFDRLEVCEFSAQAIISAAVLGDIVHIDDEKIYDLEVAFNLL